MNRVFLISASLLLVCTLAACPQSVAADESSAKHKEMFEFATKIKVHASPKVLKTKSPKLFVTPIFRWTNPKRKTDVGNVFLWTVDGRPHATLGIWTEGEEFGYEMQSLSNEPFLVEFSTKDRWKQRAGALEFKQLITKSPPGKTATRRLLEMRQLLRKRFRGRLRNWDHTEPEQLRLLAEPIFRYGDDKPKEVVDGAIFAFVQGTDPEMLVIIEARQNSESKLLTWHYAFGSATGPYLLDAYLDGKNVWNDRRKFADGTYLMRY